MSREFVEGFRGLEELSVLTRAEKSARARASSWARATVRGRPLEQPEVARVQRRAWREGEQEPKNGRMALRPRAQNTLGTVNGQGRVRGAAEVAGDAKGRAVPNLIKIFSRGQAADRAQMGLGGGVRWQVGAGQAQRSQKIQVEIPPNRPALAFESKLS